MMREKKILVCDDDQGILEMLELLLDDDGYAVVLEPNSVNALKTIEREQPDLILLDNYIGTVEAADVMKEIRTVEHLRTIPFILCSGHADISSIAADISATAYLEKPFDLAELYASIDRILI